MSASYVKPRRFAVCSSVLRTSVSLPPQNAMLSSSMAAIQQIGRADFLCAFRHLGFSPFEGLERSQRTLNRLPEPRAVARTLENAEAVGAERLREVVERVNDLRLTAPEAFSIMSRLGKGMISAGIRPTEALKDP